MLENSFSNFQILTNLTEEKSYQNTKTISSLVTFKREYVEFLEESLSFRFESHLRKKFQKINYSGT